MPGAHPKAQLVADTAIATLYLDDEEDHRGGVKRLLYMVMMAERCLPNRLPDLRTQDQPESPLARGNTSYAPSKRQGPRTLNPSTPGAARPAGAHPIRGHQSSRGLRSPTHPKVLPAPLARAGVARTCRLVIRNRMPPTASMGMARKSSTAVSARIQTEAG